MPHPIEGAGAADEATVDRFSRKQSPTPPEPTEVHQATPIEPALKGIGVLFAGHGSRRGASNEEFESLVGAFAARFPASWTAFGYVELAKPDLDSAIAEIALERSRVVLVPTFLLLAGHVKNDLPLALTKARSAFPQVTFTIASPLGVDHRLCELAWSRAESALQESLLDLREEERDRTACLLVGRGSSDPDANAEFYRIARMMSEHRHLIRVEPCFLGITSPRVEQGLDLLARLRPKRIVIVPYLLFAGRLLERLRATVDAFSELHPWFEVEFAPHLGADRVILDMLAERAISAEDGTAPLPCGTCQYREPLPGRVLQAGGMRALLWSMRHTFTHTQAMPAEHAHPAVEKHIFVCTSGDCSDRGAVPLLRKLRSGIKEQGLTKQLRVTRTACMGRCGEGPSVAVYPDGIWYREVRDTDAPEIIEEHLKGDRLVARLVDNILQ